MTYMVKTVSSVFITFAVLDAYFSQHPASFPAIGFVDAQTPTSYPCNPASWCNPQSLLCISTQELEAMVEGKDPATIPGDHGRGVCTDAYRWQCNSAGFDCKKYLYPLEQAWGRCKLILSPGKNLDWYPGKFVQACRTGEYTCNNGLCTLDPAGCDKLGGVRYSNVRCPKDTCGGDDLLKDFCQDTSLESEGAQE